jgi:hypothetical protein
MEEEVEPAATIVDAIRSVAKGEQNDQLSPQIVEMYARLKSLLRKTSNIHLDILEDDPNSLAAAAVLEEKIKKGLDQKDGLF